VGSLAAAPSPLSQHSSFWRGTPARIRSTVCRCDFLRPTNRRPLASLGPDGVMCAFNSARADAQEWVRAGVFLKRGLAGVEQFDELCGINWDWLSMEREGGEAIRTGVQVLLDNSINNLSGTDGHRLRSHQCWSTSSPPTASSLKDSSRLSNCWVVFPLSQQYNSIQGYVSLNTASPLKNGRRW
jgi:hypothetical protein